MTTHSAWWLALASAAGVIPAVVVGLTGPDFDYGLGGSMASWLALAGLFMGVVSPLIAHTPLGLVAATLVFDGVASRIIPLAQTLLMATSSADTAPQASARYEIASRTGRLAGPLLAGFLIATVGATRVILCVGLGFLLAGVLWSRLGQAPRSQTISTRTPWSAWRAIIDDPFVTLALAVRGGSNLAWPAFTLAIPLLTQNVWHAHALGFGAIRTVWGMSAVLGTIIIVPRVIRHLKPAYFLAWVISGLSFVAMASVHHLAGAFALAAIGALTTPIVHVALDSHIGTRMAQSQQSGVFAIQQLVMSLVTLCGLALMPVAIERVGAGGALTYAGAFIVLAGILGLWWWWKLPSHPKAADTSRHISAGQ